MNARVAVLIPCHDDGELVAEAVHSIAETEPVETIVVDDASTDATTHATLAALEAEGVRVVRLPENAGVAAARTIALRETRAPYVKDPLRVT